MTSSTFSKGTKCIDNSIPEKPVISGPRFCRIDKSYEFKFFSNDDDHNQLYYWISWGDDSVDGWAGPYASGEFITVQHTFYESGKCIIQAKDLFNAESQISTYNLTIFKRIKYDHSIFYFCHIKGMNIPRFLLRNASPWLSNFLKNDIESEKINNELYSLHTGVNPQ